ncbi:MAG: SEC-C metal-binding domain-containing protein [Acidobacteriota bacterium]
MSAKPSLRRRPCPCGSGKKFVECHGRRSRLAVHPVWTLLAAGIAMVALLVALNGPRGTTDRVRDLQPAIGTASDLVQNGLPAVRYRSIPGLNLKQLSDLDQDRLVAHLNHTSCTCECKLTVAECRNTHASCPHSEGIVQQSLQQLLAENREGASAVPLKSAH